jgi:hypothetical protein
LRLNSRRIDECQHFDFIEENYARIDFVPRDLPVVSPTKNCARAQAEPFRDDFRFAEFAPRKSVGRLGFTAM